MVMRFRYRFTLDNYLLEAVKLTKSVDPDKYGYSGYGIGFNVSSVLITRQ